MAGGVKWMFPSLGRHKRTTSSSPSPSPTTPAIPKEFLCPISGLLMSDPVILPSGHTFDRVCISACLDLGVDPPSSPLSPSTPLVPNLALRSSILSWSSSSSSPLPIPLQLPDAVRIVRSLSFFPSSELSPPQQPPSATNSSLSSTPTATASGEMIPDEFPQTDVDPLPISPLEAQILGKLKSCEASEQEEALLLLRRETHESNENRAMLCTATLLAALRPFLLSRSPVLQSSAVACIVNLSLEPANKTPIVRSGAIPPLVSALKSLDSDTRSNAAAAVFSLAVNEENKAALGALGALPPLLSIVSRPHEDPQTCRDALLALYHLTLSCSTNRAKLANLEAVGAFVRIVNTGSISALAHVAVMIMGNLAGCNEGKAALMDAGAVEAVVGMLKHLNSTGNGNEKKLNGRVEQCVAVIYGMSRNSLRFRGVAKAAGAEEALAAVAEGGENEGDEGERLREMARKALKALRGEDSGGRESLGNSGIDYSGSSSGSGSNSAMSFPRWRPPASGGRPGQLGVNSTEF